MDDATGLLLVVCGSGVAVVFLAYGAILIFKKDKDPDPTSPPKKSGSLIGGILKVTAIAILSLVIVFGAILLLTRKNKVDESKIVWTECQNAILNVLKSPGSATFSEFDPDGVTHYTDGSYGVKMWVDSQNGFGALVRTDIQCSMYKQGDQWMVEYKWESR